jgi:hypothetical protein
MKLRVPSPPSLAGDAREDETIAVVVQAASLRLMTEGRGTPGDGAGPTIWIHPHRLGRSLVIGHRDREALAVYDLDGHELQSLAVNGSIDGLDLAYDVQVGAGRLDVAVVTDRQRGQLWVFRIDPAAAASGQPPLVDITARDRGLLGSLTAQLNDDDGPAGGPRGEPARRGGDGPRFAFISRPDGAEVAACELGPRAVTPIARGRLAAVDLTPGAPCVCRLPICDEDTQPRSRWSGGRPT